MLDEPGTEHARDLFVDADWIQSSRILVPEAHAAVSRATRAGRFTRGGSARAHDLMRSLLAQVEPIELDRPLAERAGALATTHALRGFDAVHLASFELIDSDISVLVATDGELVRAARDLGHAVAVPGG